MQGYYPPSFTQRFAQTCSAQHEHVACGELNGRCGPLRGGASGFSYGRCEDIKAHTPAQTRFAGSISPNASRMQAGKQYTTFPVCSQGMKKHVPYPYQGTRGRSASRAWVGFFFKNFLFGFFEWHRRMTLLTTRNLSVGLFGPLEVSRPKATASTNPKSTGNIYISRTRFECGPAWGIPLRAPAAQLSSGQTPASRGDDGPLQCPTAHHNSFWGLIPVAP